MISRYEGVISRGGTCLVDMGAWLIDMGAWLVEWLVRWGRD